MAMTMKEFAALNLSNDDRPTLQQREEMEDKYYNELAELMEHSLIPWSRVTRYNR